MDQQQSQLVATIKQAKNVLVTVSKNPSVDQLAAAIGLTIALNSLGKHATAVYSGDTPSTIEFLKPENTLEKTTDSLRDFIIALDKSKADKLRYKVEDQMVRIFITPYHTAISASDLDFSQGDFNVDVVVALGVASQQDIDEAIVAHGRILHDATVVSLSTGEPTELGSINWVQAQSSSLAEMVFGLIQQLDGKVLDAQVATALLTGIVAVTERFSNDRTTPLTMSASASLMAAGANQQLITSQLEAPQKVAVEFADNVTPETDQIPTEDSQTPAKQEPGMLEVEHEEAESPEAQPDVEAAPTEEASGNPETVDESEENHEQNDETVDETEPREDGEKSDQPQISVDDDGTLHNLDENNDEADISGGSDNSSDNQDLQREHLSGDPMFKSQLSANTKEDLNDPTTEELMATESTTPLLSHTTAVLGRPTERMAFDQPSTTASQNASVAETKTLSDLEREVSSHHAENLEQSQTATTEETQIPNSIQSVFDSVPPVFAAPTPDIALNAAPLGPPLHDEIGQGNNPGTPPNATAFGPMPADFAPNLTSTSDSVFPGAPITDPAESDMPSPPPVPPPLIPPVA